MSKTFKVAAIVAVTALILAFPAFSQVRELESNTARATAGLFTTDVDDSMSVLDYTGVEFGKWFGFAGYGGSITDWPISLGFATKFDPLYLGIWYTGNIISTTKNRSDSNSTIYSPITQDWTQQQFSTYLGDRKIESDNQLQVLVGIAGMGIKVGFAESFEHQEYKQGSYWMQNNPDGSQRFDSNNAGGELVSYVDYEGYLFPQLTWGMGLDLGGIKIQPWVSAGIYIEQDREEFIYRPSFYVSPSGDRLYDGGYSDAQNYSGHSNDVLYPTFGVGARVGLGIVDIDVSYGLSFAAYDNSYDAAGFSGNSTTGFITGITASETVRTSMDTTTTENTATINFEDRTEVNHNIGLDIYKYLDVFEGLELGFGVGFEIGISTKSGEKYQRSYTEEVYESLSNPSSNFTYTEETFTHGQAFTNVGYYRLDDAPWTSTTFTFTPSVYLGARYAFSSRLQVNAGLNIIPVSIENTTTTRTSVSVRETKSSEKKDADGVVIEKEETVELAGQSTSIPKAQNEVNVDNDLYGLSATFGGGFTFNFSDRMALDLGVSSGNQSQYFNLNLATVNVLLSLKF